MDETPEWLSEEIEAALQPYADLVTPEELDLMRARLIEIAQTDPRMVALAEQARPRCVEESGAVPTEQSGLGDQHGSGLRRAVGDDSGDS